MLVRKANKGATIHSSVGSPKYQTKPQLTVCNLRLEDVRTAIIKNMDHLPLFPIRISLTMLSGDILVISCFSVICTNCSQVSIFCSIVIHFVLFLLYFFFPEAHAKSYLQGLEKC
eukprot:gene61-39_t